MILFDHFFKYFIIDQGYKLNASKALALDTISLFRAMSSILHQPR